MALHEKGGESADSAQAANNFRQRFAFQGHDYRLAAVIAGDGQIGVSYAAKNGLRL